MKKRKRAKIKENERDTKSLTRNMYTFHAPTNQSVPKAGKHTWRCRRPPASRDPGETRARQPTRRASEWACEHSRGSDNTNCQGSHGGPDSEATEV